MDVIKDWIVKNVAEFVGRPHSSGSTFHDRVVAVLNGHPEYSFRRIGPRKQVWIRRPAEESSSSDSNSDVPLMSVAEIRATYQREQAAANDDAALTPAPSDGAEESSSSDSDSDDDYSSSDSDSDDDYDPMA